MENSRQTTLANDSLRERFEFIPPSLRDLITFDFVEDTAQLLGEKFELTNEQMSVLSNQIALVVLLYNPRSELAQKLAETLLVGEAEAKRMAEIIETEVFTIFEEADQILTEANTLLTQEQKTIGYNTNNETKTVDQTETTENVWGSSIDQNKAISPIRTMDSDLEKIQHDQNEEGVVEATSQADTLSGRPRLANLPNYHQAGEDNSDKPPPTSR